MNDQSDFLDSYAPFDFSTEDRHESWALPSVKPWEPKPALAWWQRLGAWLIGGKSV